MAVCGLPYIKTVFFMVIRMDEREVVKSFNDRNPLYIQNKDFWSGRISTQMQIKYSLGNYSNRRVTNIMIDDDEFWEQYKKSSSFRHLRRSRAYQNSLYNSRREAYDMVRKDALGITESDSTV